MQRSNTYVKWVVEHPYILFMILLKELYESREIIRNVISQQNMQPLGQFDWISLIIDGVLISLGVSILKELKQIYDIKSKNEELIKEQSVIIEQLINLYDLHKFYEDFYDWLRKEDKVKLDADIDVLHKWVKVFSETLKIPRGKSVSSNLTNASYEKLLLNYGEKYDKIMSSKNKFINEHNPNSRKISNGN